MDTIECVVVRLAGSPTDAATVRLAVLLTLPLSVGADAVNNRIASSSKFLPYRNFFCSESAVSSSAQSCICSNAVMLTR